MVNELECFCPQNDTLFVPWFRYLPEPPEDKGGGDNFYSGLNAKEDQ
jgi:hypothetical protein